MADKTRTESEKVPGATQPQTDQDRKVEEQKADQEDVARVTPSAEVQAAEKSGLTEGEIKALRDDAGLNQLAGQASNVHVWEQSEAGQEFLDTEDDRVKKYEDEAKRYEEALNQQGVTEAEARYFEAVGVDPTKNRD